MLPSNEIKDELMDLAPTLATVGREMPFSVPSGYFEELPALILSRVRTEGVDDALQEIAILSPLLHGLRDKETLKLPAGYFETLQPKIRAEAPVRSIGSYKHFFRYAAAAVVAAIIGMAIWWPPGSSTSSTNLAQTTTAANASQVLAQVENMSDKEIENFMEGSAMDDVVLLSGVIENDDITLLFDDVSDAELEMYLN